MKKYYIDWNGENTPETLPEGCVYLFEDKWFEESENPCDWGHLRRRWPVSEAEYRFDLWCKLNDKKMPEGYKLLDCRPAKEGELYLSEDGTVHKAIYGFDFSMPIIEKTDEWITPDDEIAKLWIRSQFSHDKKEWFLGILIYKDADHFLTSGAQWFKYCRVKKSEVERARKERGGKS